MSNLKLKSPFSWFGGKSRVAPIIWSGLGEISNYVEPFCGSLAVLLSAPKIPKIETVNDIDHGLVNFWRAVSNDPEGVAKYADYPVSEADLHARHQWLVLQINDQFISKMSSDPDYFDVKMAGFWVYGQSASIGNNWLQSKGLKATPMLSSAGGGIHGLTYNTPDQFKKLQARLKRVRVCCGDWKRIITPAITFASKGLSPKDITGIFLDPPYDYKGRDKVYKEENNVFHEVCEWAIDNGNNPKLRIVLCGYDGDHNIPNTWRTYNWKTGGGYSGLGNSRGKDNAKREVVWFSPHCLEPINDY